MHEDRPVPSRAFLGVVTAASLLVGGLASPVAAQQEPLVTQDVRLTMSDGVDLEVRLAGRGPVTEQRLPTRPVIVEFTPYAESCCVEVGGPAYNYVKVHIRGTGASHGSFDALGPRTQQDVVEVLEWVCQQSWSDGRTGLVGFSASAITIYNSLHLDLPCVEAAVLMSGTHELYRDLLYPGGIPNGLPALGVLGSIGGLTLVDLPQRLATDPLSLVDVVTGDAAIVTDYLAHPTLDEWWQQRGFRGDANDLPILMVDGFFDVEARGAFQAFQELRDDGAHLLVVGAHDGVPAGSGGHDGARARWFDRYVRGIDNGVEDEPVVKLFLADGDREEMLAGQFVFLDGSDWPLTGTRWEELFLQAERSGTATSVNDGSLALEPGVDATQEYVAVPSLPTATDPYTTSLLGVFNQVPTVTDMTLAEPAGLSYTTAPLADDVLVVGPASLELVLSSAATETDLYAVISDVDPDGVAHPMGAGRLRTAYPEIVHEKSLVDDTGNVVQPYGRYDRQDPADISQERRYHVEFWPLGNRFRQGHRIRLHVLGTSGYHQPGVPAVNTVRVGAGQSRLLLPTVAASDLPAALGTTDRADPSTHRAVEPEPAPERTGDSPVATPAGEPLPATGPNGIVALLATLSLLAAGALRHVRAPAVNGSTALTRSDRCHESPPVPRS